ncbi:MAG: sugar nucleotide-binding protein [Proteobacteria bacterium]|nr:sugar nucleotide-binding protein [Pseudomonadota bacterium]
MGAILRIQINSRVDRMLGLDMPVIVVLGSNGMLGSTLTKILTHEFGKVIETNRLGSPITIGNIALQLDVTSSYNLDHLFDGFEIDYVINAIGLIKQLIEPNNLEDVFRAELINTTFPKKLNDFALKRDIKVIQICTDCVFSGSRGDYLEVDEKDPIDIYGETKRNGEIISPQTMLIRTSIIGKEISSSNSLLDWIVSHPNKSQISGYSDHYWNGVTTLAFSKIVVGIIRSNSFRPGISHLIPADKLSKYELVTEIARAFNRKDLQIIQRNSGQFTDRSLKTIYPFENAEMWIQAGYTDTHLISEMILEFFSWLKST